MVIECLHQKSGFPGHQRQSFASPKQIAVRLSGECAANNQLAINIANKGGNFGCNHIFDRQPFNRRARWSTETPAQGGGSSKNSLSRRRRSLIAQEKECPCPSPIGARSSGRESDNSFGRNISMLRLLLSNLLLRGNARLKADFVKSDLASPLPPFEARRRLAPVPA